MNTLKIACAAGIGVCLERGYHYEGIAGLAFIAAILIAFEARKRLKPQ